MYAKFMKDMLTKKRFIEEETICNAIIQKSLPLKSTDPRSFTILVTVYP